MAEHFEIFCVIGFIVQLVCCLKIRNPWFRMLPLLGILGIMGFYFYSYIMTADLYTLAVLVAWGLVLLAAESAWIIYAVVKLLKNAKKYM